MPYGSLWTNGLRLAAVYKLPLEFMTVGDEKREGLTKFCGETGRRATTSYYHLARPS